LRRLSAGRCAGLLDDEDEDGLFQAIVAAGCGDVSIVSRPQRAGPETEKNGEAEAPPFRFFGRADARISPGA
jgi:hypothetical protein